MLHPSYTELIRAVNSEVEDGDTPVVNSRYSIVLSTAKRARQIIDGAEPMSFPRVSKPLSIAVDELKNGLLKIQPEVVETADETEGEAWENEEDNLLVEEIVEDIVEDMAEEQLG